MKHSMRRQLMALLAGMILFALVLIGIVCFGIGINMEAISSWGPWLDIVYIYIIPAGATIGAISWFWIMKKEDLLDEVNKGSEKKHGNLWHAVGRYVYVPCAALLCIVSLVLKISF